MSEADIDRILTYVSGCLYYYGTMSARDLHERLSEAGEKALPYAEFSRLIRACGKDFDSKYPFIYEDKIFSYIEVEDPARVIAGHQSRPEIPFRPVSYEDGQAVVEERVDLLLTKHGWKLHEWMMARQEVINDETKEMTKLGLLEIMDAIRNNNRPGEVVQMVLDDIVLDSFDEANKAVTMVMEMWNNIPHWELKGWTPNEIFEKYEKPSLRPLPTASFSVSEKLLQQKEKVGRNTPCPCGSGKKYKNCCLKKL